MLKFAHMSQVLWMICVIEGDILILKRYTRGLNVILQAILQTEMTPGFNLMLRICLIKYPNIIWPYSLRNNHILT